MAGQRAVFEGNQKRKPFFPSLKHVLLKNIKLQYPTKPGSTTRICASKMQPNNENVMETICSRLKNEAIEHKSLGLVDADEELLKGYESAVVASKQMDISINDLFSHMMRLRASSNVSFDCKASAREVQLQLVSLMGSYCRTMETANLAMAVA